MKMNPESQPNINSHNNEEKKLPPIETGEVISPEVGSVAHIFNRIQELREELANAKGSYERDVIAGQIERFTNEMNSLNEKAMGQQKFPRNDIDLEINVDDLGEDGSNKKAA